MASVKNRIFVNKNKRLIDGFDDFYLDSGNAFIDHVEFLAAPRRGRGCVLHEGTAVIYFDDDGFAVAQVGDANDGAEGQFAVCGG